LVSLPRNGVVNLTRNHWSHSAGIGWSISAVYPPKAEVGYGSRKYQYPLLINSYNAGDSHKYLELQLADVFASALNHIFINWHNDVSDTFSEEIEKTKLYELAAQKHMWPSKAVTPEELHMTDYSGNNALNFIAEQRLKNPMPFNKDGY
ncbi:hypothetical protein, partial [Mucilaginibacter antarcticus]